ncbi:hypothetical protein A9404_05465 [Halothiobacillus diazotrophicus]|uniref:Aminomethyltransferase folate-binding domain-containing protein n=1 Tax=Halothiobacillus diazotrophicus TaxID=1860122 RepID=A0A191ZGB9_9GAMM|nr:folate-binding protein YgfZ [Halothiobacillus diazotrophicus]ANJ66900.1 hypothetical protein A9404_05465 [Halothiobacillus diazotrophicus]
MNTEWTTFLQQQSVNTAPSCAQAPVRMVLPNRASISIVGAEAGAFLQAMLTQEILTRTPDQAVFAALCNAKGRTLGTLLVHPVQTDPDQQAYRLTIPADLAPELIKTLRLYLLRRKLQLDVDTNWGFLGLINPSESILTDMGFTSNTHSSLEQHVLPNGLIATWEQRSEIARLSIQGPTTELVSVWNRLAPSETVDPQTWNHAEILDGIAQIAPETYQHFVPQWLNLDLKDGISFKKGCYPGQEVIARLHYLGKPNRRLLIGQCSHPDMLRPGTPISLRNDAATEAGEIVSSAPQPAYAGTGQIFLAVVRLKHIHDQLAINGTPCSLHTRSLTFETSSEEEEAQTH